MSDRTETIDLPLLDSNQSSNWMYALFFVPILAFIGIAIGIRTIGPADLPTVYIAIVFAAVSCLFPYALIRLIQRVNAKVIGNELVIYTGVGKKSVALSHLRARGLQVIDITKHPELTPRLRIWGARMPGLMSGWYSLRNGQKAMVLITDQSRVSYLRSESDNVTFMLSLKYPDRLKRLLES